MAKSRSLDAGDGRAGGVSDFSVDVAQLEPCWEFPPPLLQVPDCSALTRPGWQALFLAAVDRYANRLLCLRIEARSRNVTAGEECFVWSPQASIEQSGAIVDASRYDEC